MWLWQKSHLARWERDPLRLWTANPENVARAIGRVGLSAFRTFRNCEWVRSHASRATVGLHRRRLVRLFSPVSWKASDISRARMAPVGLFPFQGNRDLGTCSFERFGQAIAAGGKMFETELYANLFKGILPVELDRVGVFKPLEMGEKNERTLPADGRTKRLQTLFEALNVLWGGGRRARMLTDLSPKFLTHAWLEVKRPVFFGALAAHYEDGTYALELAPLVNA